jgi:hypothetical protein
MAGSVGTTQQPQVVPQGHADHRMRATGSGYAGGPTATSAKGPPADLATGHVAPPQPPPKHAVGPLDFKA